MISTKSAKAKRWGPYAWYKFHKKPVRYPETPCKCDIKCITQYYYKIFPKYIDCSSCKKEYMRLIEAHPIKANSDFELYMWTVKIHNMVNIKLGKPVVSDTQAYYMWTKLMEKYDC